MTEKFVPYEKMSKKAQKAIDRENRSVNGFNTGTRVHKTAKHPTRGQQKKDFRKMLERG